MLRLRYIVILLLTTAFSIACTSPYYPGIDSPSYSVTEEDRLVIDYIDQRLGAEYYWLNEVRQKSHLFNRNVAWEDYLTASLRRLTTNEDDGYMTNNGQRAYYSYIREIDETTRSTTMGFGIELYFTVVKIGENEYGFVVDNVYAESPAAEAGIERGDIITRINSSGINSSNYTSLFNSIHYNTASSLRLQLMRQVAASESEASYAVAIERGSYEPNPVMYSDIITLDDSDMRIGYLVYTGFDNEYDEQLLDALRAMATDGVDEVILDLRCNRGGNVASAVALCSALLGAEHAEDVLCTLNRNPLNDTTSTVTSCQLEDVGIDVGIESLTVICSNNTASAAELVVTGLQGLDVPVRLIGSTTEGKNCGMDVTRRRIGDLYIEFAPITFMCQNAKGFGDWGEGLVPDIDLTTDNSAGVSDKHYPLPRCSWGDVEHDIALAVAVAELSGKRVGSEANMQRLSHSSLIPAYSLFREPVGIRFEAEERE